jgi:hypothetical protein
MTEKRHALPRSDCLDEEFFSIGTLPIGYKGAFLIVIDWETAIRKPSEVDNKIDDRSQNNNYFIVSHASHQ